MAAGTVPEEMAAHLGMDRRGALRRWAWSAARLLVLALVLGGIARAVLRARQPAPPIRFITAAVSRGDVRATVTSTGRVEAATTVEVGAEVSGRIVAVEVAENAAVRRGQVLAYLDAEQLEATLQQQRAQVASARAAVRQALASRTEQGQLAERTTALAAQALVSAQTAESNQAARARAEAAYDVAVANAALADAALTAARSRRDKATIRSPIDGVVLARMIEPGQTVTAGFTTPVLFKLARDLTTMTLRVDIDEADIGRVAVGQRASFTVDAYPGQRFPSRVSALRNEPKISQSVVTYQAELVVDNPERKLRPGMTATATIVTAERAGVILVPNAALRFLPPAGAPHGGADPVASAAASGAASSARAPSASDAGGAVARVWVSAAPAPVGAAAQPAAPIAGPLVAVAVQLGVADDAVTEVTGGALSVGARVVVDAVDPQAKSDGKSLAGLP